jgi:hypothetical protein
MELDNFGTGVFGVTANAASISVARVRGAATVMTSENASTGPNQVNPFSMDWAAGARQENAARRVGGKKAAQGQTSGTFLIGPYHRVLRDLRRGTRLDRHVQSSMPPWIP